LMFSAIIYSLIISGIIGLVLRLIFQLKSKKLAAITWGLLPPIFIAPLSIYAELIKIGVAGKANVDFFVSGVGSGFLLAIIWFTLGVIATIFVWRMSK
jgi:hypothetical protein